MTRLTFLTAAVVLWGASAEAQTCTRDALKTIAGSYFKAVETDDMSALVTAPTVRITENAAEVKKGEGFFKTGGKAVFQRTIVDTANCGTLTQAVVEETTGTGAPVQVLLAVRLKSEGGRVTEIEQVIARKGDFPFNPVTDVELGVAVTIHNFRNDWLDVHIFKFNSDGKIALIQSVDGPGTKGTGWPLDK